MTQPTPPPGGRSPGIKFDWQDWLPYLENEDIPEEQKRQLIETLWSIVLTFVDLGFELNPAKQICGQEIDLKAILDTAVLKSAEIEFNKRAAKRPPRKQKPLKNKELRP